MTISPLPHTYPFRLADRVLEERDEAFSRGRVSVVVSAGQRAAAGAEWGSPLLLAEAIAQSALLLAGGDPEIGRSGFLAGLDAFTALRPPRAGEMLSVEVRLAGHYGPLAKFRGIVTSAGEEIAQGEILVRQGNSRP
jgi:3-hydroxymyristoyl/3-hydroxydecanoyl-(acyl carrier protein) dehydratase